MTKKNVLSIKQLIEKTGFGARSIYRFRSEGMPFIKSGHYVGFNWTQVKQWLHDNGKAIPNELEDKDAYYQKRRMEHMKLMTERRWGKTDND